MSQTPNGSSPRIVILSALVGMIGLNREADALQFNTLAFNASRALTEARERKATQELRQRQTKADVIARIMREQDLKKTPAEDAAKLDEGYLAEVALTEDLEREIGALEMAYDIARQRAWILALDAEMTQRRKLIELQAEAEARGVRLRTELMFGRPMAPKQDNDDAEQEATQPGGV